MRKKTKSVFVILMSLLILLTSAEVSFAASGDTKAPVVTSLTLDKHVGSPGDTLKVTCKVTDSSEISTDPESDAKTFLVLKNGDYFTDPIYFQKQSAGVYTGTIKIPASYISGYYFLSYFVISDVEGNAYSTYSYRDFPDIFFEVNNGESDKDVPAVTSFEIDKHAAVPGDQVTVSLQVSDVNELDTDIMSSFFYLKNDGYNSTPFVFTKIADGVYSGTITVTDRFVNGRYRFGHLTLTDSVGNVLTEEDSALYPEVYLDVSGASDDRTAPVVQSLFIDKHKVKAGDTATVTAVITDESAIDDNSLSHFLLLQNGTFFSEPFSFEQTGTDTYTASVRITKDYVDGPYTLIYYVVSDVIGNRTVYNSPSDFPEIYLSVSGNPAASYYRKPGWFMANGIWYYNNSDGQLVKGWLKIGNTWFYMNQAGEMQTGWVQVSGKWYYMDPVNGDMKTGWVESEGSWYFLDRASGAMLTGWQRIDGRWYFFKANGSMQTGWLYSGGAWYYLDPAGGQMRIGWIQENGTWYYLSGDGKMQTGWLKENGSWFYLKPSGAMAVDWLLLSGKWYYMGTNGAMRTVWALVGDSWYYMNASGAMLTGWQKIGGIWYYLKPSGVMASNEWCGGYWLNYSGSWTYQPKGSWKKDKVGWWFGDTSGWFARSGSVKIDNTIYDFDASGYWIDPSKKEAEKEAEEK